MTTTTEIIAANVAADAEINAEVAVPAPLADFTATLTAALTAMIAAQTTQVIKHELGHAKRSVEDMVQSAVDAAVSGIDFDDTAESAIEEAAENYDFSDAANDAISDAAKDLDLSDAISEAIGNGDFSDAIGEQVHAAMKNERHDIANEIEEVDARASRAQDKADEVESANEMLTARVAELEAKLDGIAPLLAAFQAAMNALVAKRTDDALARLGVPQAEPAPLVMPTGLAPAASPEVVAAMMAPEPAFARIQAEYDEKIAQAKREYEAGLILNCPDERTTVNEF